MRFYDYNFPISEPDRPSYKRIYVTLVWYFICYW